MMKMNIVKYSLVFLILIFANYVFASTITHQVENSILRDRSFPHLNVRIFTDQGTVFLDGYVNSDKEAANLVALIKTVDGVKNVDAAKLEIK